MGYALHINTCKYLWGRRNPRCVACFLGTAKLVSDFTENCHMVSFLCLYIHFMWQTSLFVVSASCAVCAKQQPFVLQLSSILHPSLPSISFPLFAERYSLNCRIPVCTQLFLPLVAVLTVEIINLRAGGRGTIHFKRLSSVNNPSVALHRS